ncbi:hypothetical protein, partial [Acetobacter indonesiensis]|uniref:hypothetical protein n=1 Tax=Acetobacter indonesiensis TaxID=104101 RepID=UPI001C4F378F
TADARYVRGIWNTTTDQRILSIARNKTDSGIYVQLDNNTSQRLQLFGDYATNTALTAETNRAATVESNLQSSKVNRDGDTLTGTLNINVPGVGVLLSGNGGGDNVPGGISYAAGVQSSPSVGATPKAIYRFINVNGVGSFATIWLTGNDGSPHELRFGADDRLRTASGNVFALTSELPLPEGMHAQIFVTSIPAGTPCGPGQEGCLVTLPIAFSSIAVVQVCNSGQNVYTISGIGVGGSQVRLWVQSPQHLSGTLVEYVNVNLNVYGYR